MRFSLLLGWTLFSFEAYAQSPTPPPPAEPAASDAIVVEAGDPVPVPLQEVAERLRAELPGSNVRVASPGEGTASSVTVGLLASGELRIVYRDASGRETTRIVADTADPRAVAATIAMIVANLHQSQLASVLGPSPAAPAPPVAPAVPVPPPAAVPAPAQATAAVVAVAASAPPAVPAARPPAVALVGAAAPTTAAGWSLELGGLYAVVAASAVVGLSHDTASGWRLGMRAVLAYLPEDESSAFATDFVAARLGRTRPGRFDFGVAGGLLLVDSGQTAGLHAGPFAQYAHRLSIGSSIGARLGLDVALIDGEASLWPTAALFWELPLG